MQFLNTIPKKKAAVITTIIMVLLLLLLFVFGLDYKDPPDEYGVEINFGYTDAGQGDNTTSIEDVKTTPETQQEQEEEQEEEEVEEQTEDIPQETIEELVTQDIEEAPVVNNKPVTEPTKPISEPTKPVTKPTKPKSKPKPDQATTDALNSILNGESNDGNSNNGDGDSNTNGNQGDINGNPYASSYYGGGSGTGSGYGLNGRNKKSNKKFPQDCNEEGKVVVKIFVNNSGKVAKTTIQQSDNPCLNAAAKKTAMSYRFNADSKAPVTQTGFVVVNFSLGE
ncbi:MAG: energy transducer TonB [Flavobacteriaceae bacterium]|nr:energy transducer TonB [Flavobacteriaceae bacterium]